MSSTNNWRKMMSKDIDSKVDELEAAKEQYMSENTVISIGGYSFTPAKLMIAGGIVSTILGGLYGAFEVYKDYQSMKEAIQTYVAPDLSEFDKRLATLEQRIVATEASVTEANEYVRDIRNSLRTDIALIAKSVDEAERRNRELDRDIRGIANSLERDVNQRLRTMERENTQALKDLEKKVDDKIQKAWENPLAK
jgi:F0F1-type ATP synthase membrane subunit b/b'